MSSPALKNANRIKLAAAELRASSHPAVQWLVAGLDTYLRSPQSQSLDEALGVSTPSYCLPWWREKSVSLRDHLILKLAETFSDRSRSRCSKMIALMAARYAANTWPKVSQYDESRDEPGSFNAILFELHRSGERWPLGWRQIHQVLNATLQSHKLETANSLTAHSDQEPSKSNKEFDYAKSLHPQRS